MKVHHCSLETNTPGGTLFQLEKADALEFHHNTCAAKHPLVIIPDSNGMSRMRNRVYNNLFRCWKHISIQPNTDFAHNTVLASSSTHPLRIYGALGAVSRITNNIVVNAAAAEFVWTNTLAFSSLYFQIDHNIYHSPKSTGTPFAFNYTRYATLAAWKAATKQEVGSMMIDPQVKTDFTLEAGSPAVNAASGTPIYVLDDYAGKPRARPATIGAYEGVQLATVALFGKGCPGTFGNVPAIGQTGKLTWGSTDFAVTLSNALGGSTVNAFFAIGGSKASIPFGGTCSLLVSADIVIVLPMGGTSGPGNGTASVKLKIPNDLKLKGATAHFQWGVGGVPAGTRRRPRRSASSTAKWRTCATSVAAWSPAEAIPH